MDGQEKSALNGAKEEAGRQAKKQRGKMIKKAIIAAIKAFVLAFGKYIAIIIITTIIVSAITGFIEDLFGDGSDNTVYAAEDFTEVTTIVGDTPPEKVWYALKRLGYSDIAVAGAMGNIDYESSGFNPEAVNPGSGASGLCQWLGDRKTGLDGFAASRGTDWKNEDIQVEFLVGELTIGGGAEGYAYYQLMDNRGYITDDWINATSVETATEAFCHMFERCSEEEASSSMEERKRRANEYYNQFQGKELEGGVTGAVSDSQLITTFTSFITGKTFYVYNQNVITEWERCCNRAAAISICSGYCVQTEQQALDLITTAKQAADMSLPGNNPNFFKTNGNLTVTHSNTDNYQNQVRTSLLSGKYVTLYIKGADAGYDGIGLSGNDWAGSMHWVAILGYKKEGNEEKIFISDSGHGNTGWYNLNEFTVHGGSEISNLLIVSP